MKESIEILKEHYIKHNYYDDETLSVATQDLIKRIQELEEENAILRKANNITKNLEKEVKIEDITQVMNKTFEEFMKDYIQTQKVKDKLEELKFEREKTYEECIESNRGSKKLQVKGIYLDSQIIILQALLEGEK